MDRRSDLCSISTPIAALTDVIVPLIHPSGPVLPPLCDSTSSGRSGYCTNTPCGHPNNAHAYTVCKARGCKKQWKRCQSCRPYRLCLSCADHPGASPYESQVDLGTVTGWGRSGEPLSASDAAGWAEESAKVWGDIFEGALKRRTNFSTTGEILPTPAFVPEFDAFLEGRVDGSTLRASGIVHWHIHMSLAGLLPPNATTYSECILGVSTPSSVTLTNNYSPNLTLKSMVADVAAASSTPISASPPTSIISREPNYLGILTIAWTYVLSAYWSEVQKGIIHYTASKAPHSSPPVAASFAHPGNLFLTLDMEVKAAELDWWCAILAPGNGWEASIDRHGRVWLSPWTLHHDIGHTSFVIVCQDDIEFRSKPPSYSESLDMLRRFVASRGLLRQASMAFMAALIVPTHNLWGIPVRLPPPYVRMMSESHQDSESGIHDFDQLVRLLPRLVTISLFGVEGVIRSAFYDDRIHSLSSGQWIQPAVASWPDSSIFATEVGCQRCPSLAKWWIGMGISGLLSRKAIHTLVGTGMWPTDLVICLWTGAKESYLCSVLQRHISLTVNGNGRYRTIPKGEEMLMLFLTSGRGPEGRLVDPACCPWRPPGDSLFQMSSTMVISIGDMRASGRLIYDGWEWGERPATEHWQGNKGIELGSIDEMAEKSGAVTRAALGWLGDIRGPDADDIVELRALLRQIQVVEDDTQVGGSDRHSDSFSNFDHPLVQDVFGNPQMSLGILGRKQFANAERIGAWNGRIGGNLLAESKTEPNEIYGFCGLDAINAGLVELGLSPISITEALATLSRTEGDVERAGMCVNELERLLNTRRRTIALVDCHSGERLILSGAKYRNSLVNVGMDSATHFIAISQQ